MSSSDKEKIPTYEAVFEYIFKDAADYQGNEGL